MSKHITGIEPATHKRFTLFKVENDATNNEEALSKLLNHYERSDLKEST